jgi:SAM-dependent methyltransferase
MLNSRPAWEKLVDPKAGWVWRDDKLYESETTIPSADQGASGGLAKFIVTWIYGRQNKAKSVRYVIGEAISQLRQDDWGLNFGAGGIRFTQRILNLDVSATANVDLVSSGSLTLPLLESSLKIIVCQEVLEHVRKPEKAIAEFYRVLRPDGELVLQLPFIIGYHPGPTDFWRFSKEAYEELLPRTQWAIFEKRITVGHGSGLHRILTEFFAVHFSLFGGRIYRLSKGLFALVFSPLILFDLITEFLPEKDRIAGGYIVRARPIKP